MILSLIFHRWIQILMVQSVIVISWTNLSAEIHEIAREGKITLLHTKITSTGQSSITCENRGFS